MRLLSLVSADSYHLAHNLADSSVTNLFTHSDADAESNEQTLEAEEEVEAHTADGISSAMEYYPEDELEEEANALHTETAGEVHTPNTVPHFKAFLVNEASKHFETWARRQVVPAGAAPVISREDLCKEYQRAIPALSAEYERRFPGQPGAQEDEAPKFARPDLAPIQAAVEQKAYQFTNTDNDFNMVFDLDYIPIASAVGDESSFTSNNWNLDPSDSYMMSTYASNPDRDIEESAQCGSVIDDIDFELD